MTVKDRKQREREAIRAKIVDAARELFIAEGYDGVSMRAIATKIEYSPALLYQHFKDKETLIKEMCYADFDALAQILIKTLDLEDPIQALRQCAWEFVHFADRLPNHYRAMFMTRNPVKTEPDEWDQRGKKPEMDAYTLLWILVGRAKDSGRLRVPDADADLLVQTFWAALHGLIALQIVMPYPNLIPWRPLENRIEAMLETLIQGAVRE